MSKHQIGLDVSLTQLPAAPDPSAITLYNLPSSPHINTCLFLCAFADPSDNFLTDGEHHFIPWPCKTLSKLGFDIEIDGKDMMAP